MKSIAMFNNKGGVGKTTFLCNLAGYFSQNKNKKVLVIDADPQCNTTQYVLDDTLFYEAYVENKHFLIDDVVRPLEGKGAYIEEDNIRFLSSKGFGFDIILGSPSLAIKEDFLSREWQDVTSKQMRGTRSTLVFADLLSKCKQYDYVFFDMGPSLGAINRSVILSCDFFITPMSSDVFSLLALENIGKSIIEWRKTLNVSLEYLLENEEKDLDIVKEPCSIKFIGYVFQQYITKNSGGNKEIVKAYEKILIQIPEKVKLNLVEQINECSNPNIDYELGSIPNFYSLIPMSQTSHKTVFSLAGADGVVGAHYNKVKEYLDLIEKIAEKVEENMEVVK